VTAPAGPTTLTWPQVAAARVARHHLVERRPGDQIERVAADVCGLHAQLLSSADLSLWARLDGYAPGDLERALWTDRRLVKLWAMRGTLHLLPSSEYPLWQAGLATYRHYLKPSWFKGFGIPREDFDRFVAAIGDALDGPPRTRTQLADAVGELTGSDELGAKLRESWGAMLKPASFRGLLCFAPNEGANVCFTRPDRWLSLPSPPGPDGDEAVAAIVRRFLAAYGPADREDIARWWAVSPAAAGKVVKGLGDEVATVTVDGWTGFALADTLDELAGASVRRSVRLLPAFDPWVIGATRQPQLLVGGEAVRGRVHRPQGWVSPVVLVDGMVAGIWRHERKGRVLAVTVEPFAPLPAWARKAVADEAERLAVHLDGRLTLDWI
jgi:hypothetical protein